ncbi:MAG: ADP-ribosyl-[dinitrogen reductase] hydrolase [Magnetococcales bacterium]|nr:ADP-ribosyl-[dinitrogen reductase] hydrolase [Magnetococcales bacterium]
MIPRRWSHLQSRATGAFLGLAVGDALGATVEFMTPNEIRARYGVHREMTGGGWLHLAPGRVTDDTTMSLALGQAILCERRIDPLVIGRAFDDWMRSKPVDIGNTVRRGILHFRRTGTPVAPPDEQDAGNGSCMRVLPVILACHGGHEADLERAVLHQGRVTHHNPLAEAGSLCMARLVRMALDGIEIPAMLAGPVADLIADHPIFRFRARKEITHPSGFIAETLRAVFQGFFDSDSFEDCLIRVVNLGGDADTTGAIAGMLAGAYHGVEAIPSRWLNALYPPIAEACVQQALGLVAAGPFPVSTTELPRTTPRSPGALPLP